jgi:hypothetical protein
VKLKEEREEREEVCSSLAALRHSRWVSGRRRGRVEEVGELGLGVLFGWYGIDERVSERARGGLGSLFKKVGRVACTRPWAAKLHAHWLERAAHGTSGK